MSRNVSLSKFLQLERVQEEIVNQILTKDIPSSNH